MSSFVPGAPSARKCPSMIRRRVVTHGCQLPRSTRDDVAVASRSPSFRGCPSTRKRRNLHEEGLRNEGLCAQRAHYEHEHVRRVRRRDRVCALTARLPALPRLPRHDRTPRPAASARIAAEVAAPSVPDPTASPNESLNDGCDHTGLQPTTDSFTLRSLP